MITVYMQGELYLDWGGDPIQLYKIEFRLLSAPAAPPTGDRAVVVDIRRGPRLAPRVPIGTTSAHAKRFFLGRSGGARATARSAASGFEKDFDRGVESPLIFRCLARPDPFPHHFAGECQRALPKLTRVRVGRHGDVAASTRIELMDDQAVSRRPTA